MITLTYGFGVALAGVAGVLAAPVMQINPLMGSNLLNIVLSLIHILFFDEAVDPGTYLFATAVIVVIAGGRRAIIGVKK